MYGDRALCQEVLWQSTEWRREYTGGTGGGESPIQDVLADWRETNRRKESWQLPTRGVNDCTDSDSLF